MKDLQEIKEELNSKIISPKFSDLKDIYQWFSELEISEIQNHFGFEDNTYCRVPLIAKAEYDLLLCCWKPGQKSPTHGHPDQGCLVKILQGTLMEELYFTNGEKQIQKYEVSHVGYINDKIGKHSVWNESNQNAVSLHLYAPGGYKPTFQ